MSFLFSYSVKKLIRLRNRKIDFVIEHPIEQQEKVLKELLSKARKTEWGKKFRYDRIKTYSDFSRTVPLQYYDDLKPYIEKMINGEKNILWPGSVKWFAKSSGTTSDKSKFIPISTESLKKCHYKASLDVFTIYLNNFPDSKILEGGKNLTIGGSYKVNKVNNLNKRTLTGDLSAVLICNLPFLTKLRNYPNADISLIPDFEEKIERIAQTSIHEDIVSISGVPSWFLVLFKRVLEITGKSNLLEVWPNLEVFAHGGVFFEPYRSQFEKLIPSENMRYLNTYNASEGFFGIQNNPNSDDMLLLLDYGIFYEFIPLNELNSESPNVFSLKDVEIGVNYALVISTNGGLWRYIVGDTIQFTSLYPFKFRITGRTKHFINAFGEELIVDNAEKALKKTCEITGAVVQEYTAAPIFMTNENKGAHQWIIEFEKEPKNIAEFAEILDQSLQEVNSDYEAKRFKNMALTNLQIVKAPEQTFYNWMKFRGKIGGQNKIPRLSNSREYINQLLEIINKQKN